MQLSLRERQFQIKLVKYSNNSFKAITKPLTYFSVTTVKAGFNTSVFTPNLTAMKYRLNPTGEKYRMADLLLLSLHCIIHYLFDGSTVYRSYRRNII